MIADMAACPACGDDVRVIPAIVQDRVSKRISFVMTCDGCPLVSEVDASYVPSRLIDLGGHKLTELVELDAPWDLLPLVRTVLPFQSRRES